MFKVRLLQPTLNFESRRVVMQAEVIEGNYREFYDETPKDVDYELEIKRWREKRSLDANSYYHVLIGKIADRMDMSKAEVKNMTLARYGQLEIMNGKAVFLIVPEEVEVEKWEELHLRSTSQTKILNGVTYRVYMQVRGSHTYNTAEMATLINGTLSEGRYVGLTDAELMSTKEKEMLEKQYGCVLQPGEMIHPLDKLLEETDETVQ